jgi:hypothetical protein
VIDFTIETEVARSPAEVFRHGGAMHRPAVQLAHEYAPAA